MSQELVAPMSREEAMKWVTRGQKALGKIGSAWKSTRKNLAEYRRCLVALKNGHAWIPLGYRTFEECGLAVFGKARSQLYRDLKAAELDQTLFPNGDLQTLPESICRTLSLLESLEERVEVAAVAFANGRTPTAAQVQEEILSRMSSEQKRRHIEVAAGHTKAAAAKVDASSNDVHAAKSADGAARILHMGEALLDKAHGIFKEAKRSGKHATKWKRCTKEIAADWRQVRLLAGRIWRRIALTLGHDIGPEEVPYALRQKKRKAA